MKIPPRFVFMAIILFLWNNAFSQSNPLPEWTFEPGNGASTTHPTVVTNGLMIPYNMDDCHNEWIAFVNKSTGKIKYLPGPENASPAYIINDVIQTGPNEFVAAGYYGKGFDVVNKVNSFFFKFDSSGNVKWKTFGGLPGSNVLVGFKKIVSADDGNLYALVSGDKGYISKVSSGGKLFWYKNIKNANDILWTSKGLIAVSMGHIYQLDTSGIVLKDFGLPGSNIQILQNMAGNKIFGSSYGKYYHFSTDIQIIDSAAFGFGFNNTNTAIAYAIDSGYYIYDQDSLAAFDLKMNRRWSAVLPNGNTIKGLAFNGSTLAVTGNGPAPFVKMFDNKGNTAPVKRDIGIVSISTRNVKLTLYSNGAPVPAVDIEGDADITVKNTGLESIDSFYIESLGIYRNDYYQCLENALSGFKNTNLAPGNATTVTMHIKRIMVNPTTTGYPFDFIVTVKSPNSKMDADNENDSYHYSKTYASIKGDLENNQTFKMFPNPATSSVAIENADLGSVFQIKLFTSTGQQISEYHNVSGHFEMNTSQLPSGVYYVKMENTTGSSVQKLIKD